MGEVKFIEQSLLSSNTGLEWVQRNFASLELVVNWAENFLSRPHAELGRTGQVCPFTKPSLDKGHFYLHAVNSSRPSPDDVADLIREAKFFLKSLIPLVSAKDSVLVTILICFPDINEVSAGDIIDKIHEHIKPEFVAEGLMIGQFHPLCEESGLHNQEFRPLQSPVPLLAIRSMVPGDFLFLKSRKDFIEGYISHIPIDRVPLQFLPELRDCASKFGINIV